MKYLDTHSSLTAARALEHDKLPDPEHYYQALPDIVQLFRTAFFFLHIGITFCANSFFVFKRLHDRIFMGGE